MAEVRLSADADRDLDGILEYGAGEWGLDRALAYLEAIDDKLAFLARQPFTGTLRREIGDDVRSLPCGSHILYFESDRERVTILRVLHYAQAPERHLRSGE